MLTLKLSGFYNIELTNGEVIEWKYINTPNDFSLNKESFFLSYMASIKRETKTTWNVKPYYAIGVELKINMGIAYNSKSLDDSKERLTNKIARWANTRYEDNPRNWYHSLEVAVYKAESLIRSIKLTKAFIIEYKEYYNKSGVRIAHILVGQRGDLVDEVLINGEAYGKRVRSPQLKPTNFLISSSLLRENPLTIVPIELGDTLDYILTLEQRRNLRNLIRNHLSTDNFFNSLSREQQRQLQFLNSERLSRLNDSQRLSLLKYLNDNSRTNRISHDFLRELGLVPEGLNRRQIAHNIETPILMEYIAITQSGNDLAHHERIRAEQRMNELFATIAGGAAAPRLGGNNQQPQRQQSQQNIVGSQSQQNGNNPNSTTSPNGVGNSVITNNDNIIDTTPARNHSTVTRNPGLKGTPNSSIDILDRRGNLATRRWFDKNGRQFRDVDFTDHGFPNNHPEVPHEHGSRLEEQQRRR
ncbi:MAG: hypothetical protein FWF50_05110 [Defluviitaleaceae bacterium]|nr:hypothetical protein [Defluviitaleaceae bacterium]